MTPYLAEGRAVACVGSPHVVGVSRMLREEGYAVEHHAAGPKKSVRAHR